MKIFATIAFGILFLAGPAWGQASWSQLNFAASAPDAPAVIGAADMLMGSAAGKKFPGQLLLQVALADGDDPTTHSFVPIYNSAGEREDFVAKLQADPAWAKFQGTMAKLTKPVSTVMYRTLKSWGDVNDTDGVWATHAFRVTDPAGFVAAVDGFIGSAIGKKAPGQVHLSAVVAGGITPVTHIISVGYASQAEMETWVATRNASPDWAAYQKASRDKGEYMGTRLFQTAKRWGPAKLDELTGD